MTRPDSCLKYLIDPYSLPDLRPQSRPRSVHKWHGLRHWMFPIAPYHDVPSRAFFANTQGWLEPYYTKYIRYLWWQGNHQKYGHIRCIYIRFWPTLHIHLLAGSRWACPALHIFFHHPIPWSYPLQKVQRKMCAWRSRHLLLALDRTTCLPCPFGCVLCPALRAQSPQPVSGQVVGV